ncbi:MAG: hypothetical protein Tsb008_06960 [Rhodothalassiaceae bacterium]
MSDIATIEPDTALNAQSTADWTDMPQLSQGARELVKALAARAASMEKSGRRVDELSLFHERLKADLTLGIKVQRNSVLGDMPEPKPAGDGTLKISLPHQFESVLPSFDEVVMRRRSVRDYMDTPIELARIARMLMLGFGMKSRVRAYGRQGIPTFHAPTGGGLQSTRIMLVAHNIEGVARGIHEYLPETHELLLLSPGEVRWKMFELCAYQDWIAHSAGVVVLVTDLQRVRWKYEERSYRLAHLDAGVIGQNMHLAATALDLASCLVFGFVDDEMDRFLGLEGDADEFTSILMPFGRQVPRYMLTTRASADTKTQSS